jgi:hypothetical protein
MNKQKIALIVLAVALFVVLQYIIIDKLEQIKQEQMLSIYQSGYSDGLKTAITSLFEQTQNCQTTTIAIGNLTKQVIGLDCLKTNSHP